MIPFAFPPLNALPLDVEPLQTSAAASRLWRFESEHVLGTQLEVLVATEFEELAQLSAQAARNEIERLDRVFNHRVDDSELSLLNRSRRAQVGADLFAVVQASELWRAITQGAFDGRMGRLFRLWAGEQEPNSTVLAETLANVQRSTVHLDTRTSLIELSAGAELSLDAIAKGYIVDAALNAARLVAPAIEGLAISIGGDVRSWGAPASARAWRIGIPDSSIVAMNAPLVDTIELRNAAVATSGRGPRDCDGHRVRSRTLSPITGRPVEDVMSVSAVASHAMDADALATACLVLTPQAGLALAERIDGAAVRIVDAQGQAHLSADWPTVQLAATSPEEHIAPRKKTQPAANQRWPDEWVLSIDYTAPPRQTKRSSDFRSPYMAMWVTNENDKPVRTVLMVGRELDWQRDNFVWWNTNRARTKELVDLRSLPTSVSGRYPVYWTGLDDDGNPVPPGKYTLHLETSQERGKHHYRNITLELGRTSFRQALPKLDGSGSLDIYYGHPAERYK